MGSQVLRPPLQQRRRRRRKWWAMCQCGKLSQRRARPLRSGRRLTRRSLSWPNGLEHEGDLRGGFTLKHESASTPGGGKGRLDGPSRGDIVCDCSLSFFWYDRSISVHRSYPITSPRISFGRDSCSRSIATGGTTRRDDARLPLGRPTHRHKDRRSRRSTTRC